MNHAASRQSAVQIFALSFGLQSLLLLYPAYAEIRVTDAAAEGNKDAAGFYICAGGAFFYYGAAGIERFVPNKNLTTAVKYDMI